MLRGRRRAGARRRDPRRRADRRRAATAPCCCSTASGCCCASRCASPRTACAGGRTRPPSPRPAPRCSSSGVGGALATALATWRQAEWARGRARDASRAAVPAGRARRERDGAGRGRGARRSTPCATLDGVDVLGPAPVDDGLERAIVRFDYARGRRGRPGTAGRDDPRGDRAPPTGRRAGAARGPPVLRVRFDDPDVSRRRHARRLGDNGVCRSSASSSPGPRPPPSRPSNASRRARTRSSPSSRVPRPRSGASACSRRRRWRRPRSSSGSPSSRRRDSTTRRRRAIAALEPDLGVIVAYGGLVREPLLSTAACTAGSTCTSRCCRRGAAPRPCSTRSSPATPRTGASVFQLVPELDAGDVFATRSARDRAGCHGRRAARRARDRRGRPARRRRRRASPAARPRAIAAGRASRRSRPKLTHRRRAPRLDGSRPTRCATASAASRPSPAPGRRSTAQRLKVLELAAAPTCRRPLAPGELAARRPAPARRHRHGAARTACACSRRDARRWPRPTGGVARAATARWRDERADGGARRRRPSRRARSGPGSPAGAATSASRPRASSRSRCSRRCATTRPTPTCCCRRASAAPASTGGCRLRDRAHLRHAAHAGLLRRGHRPRRGPPDERDRPGRARRAPARRPPAARHPGADARRRQRVRSRSRRRVAPKAAGLRQRGAAHDLAHRRPRSGASSSAEGAKGDDDRLARLESHPGVDRARPARRARRTRGAATSSSELLEADNASPRVNLAVLPGLGVDVDDIAGLDARPVLADRRRVGRRPASRVAEASDGPHPRAGRGIAARRARADAGRARARRGSGGSTSARARAARPPCSRPRRSPAVRRWSPTRSSPRGPSSCARRSPGSRRRSTCTSATAATLDARRARRPGRVRPHPARRAVHRARRAAPPPRGALAQVARGRRRAHEAAGRAARRGRRARSRPAASSPTSPARRTPRETHGSLARRARAVAADASSSSTPRAVVQGLSRHPLDLAGAPETVQLWPHRHGTDAMFIALRASHRGGCRRTPSTPIDRLAA